MKNSIIFFVVVMVIFTVIYFAFFKKKKESNFKIEYTDPKMQMKSMMGMGGYGSVLGCENGKCY